MFSGPQRPVFMFFKVFVILQKYEGNKGTGPSAIGDSDPKGGPDG